MLLAVVVSTFWYRIVYYTMYLFMNYYPQIRLPENIKARKYKLSLDINWDKWDYSGTQEVSDILKFDKDYLSVANEI